MIDRIARPEFGPTLRSRRQAAAMSQRELAHRAGISTAAVRDLEQGRTRHPKPDSMRRLMDALGITPDHDLRLRLLGPILVNVDGCERPVAADRQRTVLARLALSPNESVPRSELLTVLWGEQPPESAVNLVQTYVARLRRLAGDLPVRYGPGGYTLSAGDRQLDVMAFRHLARPDPAPGRMDRRAGRTDRLAGEMDGLGGGMDRLERALALWRGPPAADVPALAEHPAVIALANERVEAVVRHADLADTAAAYDRALPFLREAAECHPLHEALWGRLILALAATGGQAAALSAYAGIRHRLREDLGVHPGPELMAFHQRVLRQAWTRAGRLLGRPRRQALTVGGRLDGRRYGLG